MVPRGYSRNYFMSELPLSISQTAETCDVAQPSCGPRRMNPLLWSAAFQLSSRSI